MIRFMSRNQKLYLSHFSYSTVSAISPVSLFIRFEETSLLAYVNELQCSHINQEEIWRKLWKEMTSLFRVAGCAGLSFLMWKGSKQSHSALLRKIDVRMWEIKSASKGNTTGSRRDEKAEGEQETSVKSLLLLHCNRGKHSCLLLSAECSCKMLVVWVRQVQWHKNLLGCMSAPIRKKVNTNCTMCAKEKSRGGERKIVFRNEEVLIVWVRFSLWKTCFDMIAFALESSAVPLAYAMKADFPAYRLFCE